MADTRNSDGSGGFSADERAAMRERAAELRAEARKKASKDAKADPEGALRAKIAEMPDHERAIAERIDAIVREVAPHLEPKTWYGMPAYAKQGKVVCFFQAGSKFDSRYSTFGFQDAAALDEGTMWPTSYGITALSAAVEKEIRALVKKAAG